MASVDFTGVGKTFEGGAHAVLDLNLHVEDAELMVLVGPSGCGKSTVLRMLAGLEAPTTGTIRIADKVVNALAPQERNVAMVFQDYALYPFMSVRKNIEFPLKMRKIAGAELQRRVAAIAALLDLGPLLDRLPKQLSGGQRQRVAMGRALVREPAVSLLDEPLSNLDAKLRVQVRAEIADLQRRTRTTMLYVTHDQVEAMTLGHRVAVLNQGRLQQVATPRELYDHPANVFVAGFIGNPPMNLLPISWGKGGELSIGTQTLPLLARAGKLSVGESLTLGIRPEALHAAEGSAESAIEASVRYVEYLGHEMLVYADVASSSGEMPLVARLPGVQSIAAGAKIRLALDADDIRLFDSTGTLVDAVS